MNNNIQINMLGEDGLPLYDENGDKYDDPIIPPKRNLKCGKPKMYDEGWLIYYKTSAYYKVYTKKISAIPLKCKICGTMSFKIGIHQHQKSIKCMESRKVNDNELSVVSVL